MKYHLKLCSRSQQVICRFGPFESYDALEEFYLSGLIQGKLIHGERQEPVLIDGETEVFHEVAMATIEFQDGSHSFPTFLYHPDLGGLVDWSKITG